MRRSRAIYDLYWGSNGSNLPGADFNLRSIMFDAFDSPDGEWFTVEVNHADADRVADTHPWLRCVNCGHALTTTAYAFEVGGREVHTGTNPAGFTYQMRTFSLAPGCRVSGPTITDDSWFAPLAWQIADCAACHNHCGWCFSEQAVAAFFALIEERLHEDEGQ
jgi:hypothetical protein